MEIGPGAVVEIVAVAALAFLSTGCDNFAVLVACFGARELAPRRIAAGYLAATALVVGVSFAGAKLVEQVPLDAIAHLGAIPIALGLWHLWRLRRPTASAPTQERPPRGGLAVAAITLAQSADNLIVYVSLFADTTNPLDGVMLSTLLACAGGWTLLAFWLARRSPLAATLERAMRVALPFLLIAVGAYILIDTPTDVSPG